VTSRELTLGGPDGLRLRWSDPGPETSVTVFASRPAYVPRSEARDLHLGRRSAPGPAYFLLPLRRALSRLAPGAFDSPPRDPWRFAELRDGALRLDLRADAHDDLLPEVVEAAEALGLSLYDAAAAETSQPMRLDRADLLAEALADVAHDGYLILEGGPGSHLYVQAFGDGADGVLVEAVSSRHLPPELALSPWSVRSLLALGFEPPGEENRNFRQPLPRRTATERGRAATCMLRALVEAYGAELRATYRLRTSPPDELP
jgi:hypothetical protein